MGYVVPVGGFDITGVLFELTESVLLQAAINKLRSTILKILLILSNIFTGLTRFSGFTGWAMLEVSIQITLRWNWLILLLWNGLAGQTILALDPPAEIY